MARGEDVLMMGQGQLADWEGAYVQTGTVATGSNNTTFTVATRTALADVANGATRYNTAGLNRFHSFYSGPDPDTTTAKKAQRLLEFTDNGGGSGPATGTQRLIVSYVPTISGAGTEGDPELINSATITLASSAGATPQAGQGFKIYSIGDQNGSYGNVTDGLDYQTILSFRDDTSHDGQQLRPKFASVSPTDGAFTNSVSAAVAVPDGKDLYIKGIIVGASLGYLMAKGTEELASHPGTFLGKLISLQGAPGLPAAHPIIKSVGNRYALYRTVAPAHLLQTQGLFDDAFAMFRWQILVDGSVYRNYTNMLPLSKLRVPSEVVGVSQAFRATSGFGHPLSLSPALEFERMFDGLYNRPGVMIGEDIHVPSGATFEIKGKLTAYQTAVEYDVAAWGQYI